MFALEFLLVAENFWILQLRESLKLGYSHVVFTDSQLSVDPKTFFKCEIFKNEFHVLLVLSALRAINIMRSWSSR